MFGAASRMHVAGAHLELLKVIGPGRSEISLLISIFVAVLEGTAQAFPSPVLTLCLLLQGRKWRSERVGL